MDKIFGYRGMRIIIPLVDWAIIYFSVIICFFFWKDYLDNFKDNYDAFNYMLPYILVSYLIISHIFEFDKPKDFSLFGVTYTAVLVIFTLFCATMAISYLTRQFAYPRSILLMSSLIQIVALSGWHLFTNIMYRRINEKKTILVVGFEKSKELAYKLLETDSMWSRIKYICKPTNPNIFTYIANCDITFLAEDIDENTKQDIVRFCVKNNHSVMYEPKNPEILLFNARFVQVNDTPLLDVKDLHIPSGSESVKRFMDVFIASIGTIALFIPFTITYLALKIGGGSAFYTQERVTRGGKTFKIYKFRTMIENAESKSGPVLAQNTDARITRMGHIMRTTRLDEIPQIFNVLKGDMSIVGPRPERPFFVDQFCEDIPEYNLRHRVKAGLTGLAQVQGKYNTTVKDKLKYDLLYINGYSLALDVKLIMQTLNILLRKSSTEGLKDNRDLEQEIRDLIKDEL